MPGGLWAGLWAVLWRCRIYPVSNSSRIVTLFSSQPAPRRGPSSYTASVLAHAVLIGLVLFVRTPHVVDAPPPKRYVVRILKLQTPDSEIHWSAGGATAPTGPPASASPAPAPGAQALARQPAAPPAPNLARQSPVPLTLLQPDTPPDTLPLKTPIPLVVLWSPQKVPVPKIVPPPPQMAAAKALPSLETPNQEANVSDLKLSATPFVSVRLPALPATTTPVKISAQAPNKIPQTTSTSSAQPSPAAVLSISKLLMKQGTVVLPAANVTVASSSGQAPGPPSERPQAGKGAGAKDGAGKGTAAGKGTTGETAGNGNANGALKTQGGMPGEDSGPDAGPLAGEQLTVTRITLPKNGSFGVVVVGASVAQEYPEALAAWADRLAYTVYLHVGAVKNWIMQYSLPRDVEAASRDTRLGAPWPYAIVRPNLAPGDVDADAVLVHGYVNANGQFEKLAIVYPPQFSQSKFVLDALQQWQFRPASQNGQAALVEVLLIIPDESE